MGHQLQAVGASMAVLLSIGVVGAAEDRSPSVTAASTGGLRTDRLSSGQLETWKKVVDIVLAEDESGRPLHPTLRQLWETVQAGDHVVHVEMPRTRSYFAGRFEVTRVDPEGQAHEAVLLLNLKAIDKASTGPAAARAAGFTPFQGLGKHERYAEVLGHELAHAVWHLSDPDRARIALTLQRDMERAAKQVLKARAEGRDPRLEQRVQALRQLGTELEKGPETAELAIWQELRASRRLR